MGSWPHRGAQGNRPPVSPGLGFPPPTFPGGEVRPGGTVWSGRSPQEAPAPRSALCSAAAPLLDTPDAAQSPGAPFRCV